MNINHAKINKYMKRLIVISSILTIFFHTWGQQNNKIGFEFGSYIIATPKYNLTSNQFNPYTELVSGMFGIFYQRHLNDVPFAIRSGLFFNYQYKCLRSFHVPVEIQGYIIGKKPTSFFQLGCIGGISYNRLVDILSTVFYFSPPGTNAKIEIQKYNYLAPHIGMMLALNLKRINITGEYLFHFLVPNFIKYTVKYNNLSVEEHNTNRNYGYSLRFGIAYQF